MENNLDLESSSKPVRFAFRILQQKDRKKAYFVATIQTMLGFLDLVGVALLGVLGALSISGIQSRQPGGKIENVLQLLGIQNFSFQNQVASIAMLSVVFLVGRTLLTAIISQRTFRFLSMRSADISSNLSNRILNEPFLKSQNRSVQDVIFAVTGGVNALVVGLIGSLIALFSDISLLVILTLGLVLVDFSLAVGTLLFFSAIGMFLHKIMNTNAGTLGMKNSILQMSINRQLSEALISKRELFVRDRIDYYASNVRNKKFALAEIEAKQAFLPNISKYILESSVLVGALVIAGYQFLTNDASHAIGNLSIFMAAGFRIAPAVLRVQQGYLNIKVNSGAAGPAIDLVREFGNLEFPRNGSKPFVKEHADFNAYCKINNVNYAYPNADAWSLKDINLEIKPGEFVAIVGNSGAGKTTLVDILLGLIETNSGFVEISGMKSGYAIKKWPGAIAYVPQETTIVSGSIAQNVALGFNESEFDELEIVRALSDARLLEFVNSLSEGISSEVGERGTNLSGGQRQRLGIARALYTQPKLVVMDEATSALDAETENLVSESIRALRGRVTVIAIAHRLSTVKLADKVVYLENGRVAAVGSFEYVRSEVPNFDFQAKLFGL